MHFTTHCLHTSKACLRARTVTTLVSSICFKCLAATSSTTEHPDAHVFPCDWGHVANVYSGPLFFFFFFLKASFFKLYKRSKQEKNKKSVEKCSSAQDERKRICICPLHWELGTVSPVNLVQSLDSLRGGEPCLSVQRHPRSLPLNRRLKMKNRRICIPICIMQHKSGTSG